jgi:hypothetical protein
MPNFDDNPVPFAYSIGLMTLEQNLEFYKNKKPLTLEQIRELKMRVIARNAVAEGLIEKKELLEYVEPEA